MQHLRYPVDNVTRWFECARPAGYEPLWSREYPAHNIRWAFLGRPYDPLTIELV